MKFETLRNGVANLMGAILPAVAAVLTTRVVVNALGDSRYGMLTLITAIIGYFSIIDINITAGSVKYVAEHHATGNTRLRNETLTSGFVISLLIGIVGCALILGTSGPLTRRVFTLPGSLSGDATAALRLAAFGFLLGQLQIYLASVLPAIRRYDKSALLESVFGVVTPVATAAVVLLGYGLYEIVAVRIALSVVHLIVVASLIRQLLPDVAFQMPRKETLSALGRFSGFAYLSRLASVASSQGDKLILGALTSMSALTYYAVPTSLVSRLFALTYRLSSVLFPVASAMAARREIERLRELYLYASRYVLFVNCALTILLVTLSREILLYWIGPVMADRGATLLSIIALAALVDSMTNAPSLVNDGLGRPAITGTFAIARAVSGVSLALLLVRPYGALGAAAALLVTASIMALLFIAYVHGRSIPVALREYAGVVLFPVLPVIACAGVVLLLLRRMGPLSVWQSAGLFLLECGVLAAYALAFVFRPADRRALVARLWPRSARGAPARCRRMRILLVTEDLGALHLGGAGKHAVLLGNGLLAAGHHVEMLGRVRTPGDDTQSEFEGRVHADIDFSHTGWREDAFGVFNPLVRLHRSRRILQAIRRRGDDWDVVHYHGHLPMLGALLPAGARFVHTLHDQGADCITSLRFKEGAPCVERDPKACAGCATPHPSTLQTVISSQAVRSLRTLARASFIRHQAIFVSQFLERRFRESVGPAPLRSHVIHNFIDTGQMRRALEQAGAPAEPRTRPQIVLVGRIDRGKGFSEFLELVPSALLRESDVCVAGDGPELAFLRRQHADRGVRFLGWQPQDVVYRATAAADACIVPSTCEEAFGLTTLEALAMGRPVYALDRGATPELSAYQRYPGQLMLFASIRDLVAALAGVRRCDPCNAVDDQADVSRRLPQILSVYESSGGAPDGVRTEASR